MTSLSFQFHAEPDEILSMASDWARSMDLNLVLETFWPYSATLIGAEEPLPGSPEICAVRRVSLWMEPFSLDLDSKGEFDRSKSEGLTIIIGTRTAESLRESFMSAATRDPAVLATWRKIRRLAQKSMYKGASVVNPVSGARGEVSAHRYTAGALRAARAGVTMLAIAGWNEYEFGELKAGSESGAPVV